MIWSLLIFVFFAAVGGGMAYVILPYISSDARSQMRIKSVTANRAARIEQESSKRKNVAEALKQAEDIRSGRSNPSLEERLRQAGLEINKTTFFAIAGIGALVTALLLASFTGSLLFGLLAGVAGGLGLPNWVLNYLIKRRMTGFTSEFPSALDVITRGIKAGLPLTECLQIVGKESPDPLGREFRLIVEGQQMGMSLSQAIERMAERTPSSEASFFAIAIAIQQKSGGNLAEALGNLSRVLRERKQMKMKIKAMSTEATASAAIIACMPPGVAFMVYLTSPEYISLLWTTSTGQVSLMLSAFWMGLGITVMRKMISFEI